MILTMDTVGSDQATTGMMTVAADSSESGIGVSQLYSFYTLELPWLNNDPNKSCVPAGTFELLPYNSPTHGQTLCLRNPDLKIMGYDILTAAQIAAGFRSVCELHSANWARQLLGCIALGLEGQPLLDPMTGRAEPAVENSRDAVAHLFSILAPLTTGHILIINRQ